MLVWIEETTDDIIELAGSVVCSHISADVSAGWGASTWGFSCWGSSASGASCG